MFAHCLLLGAALHVFTRPTSIVCSDWSVYMLPPTGNNAGKLPSIYGWVALYHTCRWLLSSIITAAPTTHHPWLLNAQALLSQYQLLSALHCVLTFPALQCEAEEVFTVHCFSSAGLSSALMDLAMQSDQGSAQTPAYHRNSMRSSPFKQITFCRLSPEGGPMITHVTNIAYCWEIFSWFFRHISLTVEKYFCRLSPEGGPMITHVGATKQMWRRRCDKSSYLHPHSHFFMCLSKLQKYLSKLQKCFSKL